LWLRNPKTLLLPFFLLFSAKLCYIIAEPYYIAEHYCITAKLYCVITKVSRLIGQSEVVGLIFIYGMLKRLKKKVVPIKLRINEALN